MSKSRWELVNESDNAYTERLKIDKGYLYHVAHKHTEASSLCFVPDDIVDFQTLNDTVR